MHSFSNGDVIQENYNSDFMFTNGEPFTFSESLLDAEGYIEVVGKGKIHINNFHYATPIEGAKKTTEELLEKPNQYSRGFEDGEAYERLKTEQVAREAWIAVQGDDSNFDLWFEAKYGSNKNQPTEAAIVIPVEILDEAWEEPKPRESGLTTDPNDPDLKRGVDEEPVPQNKKYLVLSEEERAKGFVRPVRNKYIHTVCGGETKMGDALSETYARDPKFYGATYCVHCAMHKPVAEFVWSNTNEVVGS